MELEQRIVKNFKEAKYLNDLNSYRYITIVHYLCEQHRLYAPPSLRSEIYEWIKENDPAGMFAKYQESDLDYDLKVLEENGNVISHQDSSRVPKIEDYKKRKLRYQCTTLTIEFERKLAEINEISSKIKGSLDPTLTESLRKYIDRFNKMEIREITSEERGEMNLLWRDLFTRFKDLQQETSDYLAIIHGKYVEQALQSKEIAPFRTKFTDYLRSFVMVLQEGATEIDYLLREIEKKQIIPWFISEMVSHHLNRPLLDEAVESTEIENVYEKQWRSLRQWFVLGDGSKRYVDDLIRETGHTISKFVRYVQIMSERDQQIQSRKHDFLHFASMFDDTSDLRACRRYFSTITNLEAPPHLLVDERQDIDSKHSILEYDFPKIQLKPRVDYDRRKRVRTVVQRTEEDEHLIAEMHARKEYEEALVADFISHGEIALADLEVVEPSIRKMILYWISRAVSSDKGTGRNENGTTYQIEKRSDALISLRCTDGILRMPDYVFKFGGSHEKNTL